MTTIELNYAEVLGDSNKMAGLADKGEQCLRELKKISSSIPTFWTGAASGAFINLCVQEEREMAQLINALNTISENLKIIAKDIKNADDRSKTVIDQ